MSGTRNGSNGARPEGPPCPSRQTMAGAGRNKALHLHEAPADEELARQLNSIFAEIEEAESPPHHARAEPNPPVRERTPSRFSQSLRRYGLNQDSPRDGPPLAWLNRSVNHDYPEHHRTPQWRKYANTAAPLIAVGVLLSLYPAFQYVLHPGDPAQSNATGKPAEKPAVLGTVAQPPEAKPSNAAGPSQPIRVRTIRVIPGHDAARPGAQEANSPNAQQVEKPQGEPAAAHAAVQPRQPETAPPARPDSKLRPVRAVSQAEVKTLLERGRSLTGQGDIAGAKLAYQYLAEAGNAEAALELARLHDPKALAQLGVIGMSGDRDEALYWYTRAAELGNLDAARSLASAQRR